MRVEKRQPVKSDASAEIREPVERAVEKAYSMGERMGFLTAQETGVEFIDHFEASLSAPVFRKISLNTFMRDI